MNKDQRQTILEELRAALAHTSQQAFSVEEVMSLVRSSLHQRSPRRDMDEFAWMEQVHVPMIRFTEALEVRYANQALLDVFGLASLDPLIADNQIVFPNLQAAIHLIEKIQAHQGPFTTELRMFPPTGKEVWMQASLRLVWDAESQTNEFEGILVDITSLKIALASFEGDVMQQLMAAQEYKERMSTLYDTTKAILAETELKVLLELIVQRAVSLSGTAKGTLFLLDTEKETVIEAVSVGSAKSHSENITYQEVSEGISGWVIRNKQRTLSNNLLTDPRNTGLALERAKTEVVRSQSCAIAPLMIGEEILGTLTVVHNVGNERLDVIDLELISHLAGQAAVAIQNARLVDATRLQLRYAKALRSIDSALNASLDLRVFFNVLFTHLTKQLGVDAADVLIYNRGLQILTYYSGLGFRTRDHHPTRLRVGKGYAGRVIMERKPLVINNLREVKEDGHFRLLDEEGFHVYYGWPLIARGEVQGVLEVFHRGPIIPDTEWMTFFKSAAESAAIAIADAKLLEDLQRTNDEMILAYDATLEGWVRALDIWAPKEEEHTWRVTEVALQLAQEMGISGKTLHDLRRGALLHTIGRMGIDPVRWTRFVKGNYTDMEIHRDLANNAYQILRPIEYLRSAMEIPYAVYENWDGSGVPRGLQGEKIPLLARLVSVVHTWDTLQITSNQQTPLTRTQATAFVQDQAGKRFDPAIVEAFSNMLDKGLLGEQI